MLRIYYKTLNGNTVYLDSPLEQTRWLLSELTKEFYSKDTDDSLITPLPPGETSILTNIEKIAEEIRGLKNDPDVVVDKEFETLSSILLTHSKNQLLQIIENRNFLDALSGLDGGKQDDLVVGEKNVEDRSKNKKREELWCI